ncbi:hypothetical protein [Spirosoma taeanense]|uniref:hypothetical protein n=1 Tax=Spirosoma taeanense TaxID=2735870 RepID=UPI001F03DA4B|nr:hypothetical protein [Spirosoma taeanense]
MGKYNGHLSPSTYLTLTTSSFWSRWNHSGQIPDRLVLEVFSTLYPSGVTFDVVGSRYQGTNK